jgi:hypothetical protein
MSKDKENNEMESVCEALGSITPPRLTIKEDYIGGQFDRLDTGSELYNIQISDGKGGKTNNLSINANDLQKIKAILQASKTAN